MRRVPVLALPRGVAIVILHSEERPLTNQVDSVRMRGWSASPQDVHTLISATRKHYLLWQR